MYPGFFQMRRRQDLRTVPAGGTHLWPRLPTDTSSFTATPPSRARKSVDQWSDKAAGYAAAFVVGALGLVFLLIIAGVLLYATSWGYSVVVQFPASGSSTTNVVPLSSPSLSAQTLPPCCSTIPRLM